ncbi:MAG TPA: penicillin-binding protein 2 [Bacillota bacterium]|nr:penicillin-binding protein 2 [Bacillota bacterium]HOL09354.1 penicillin-binding protein 2 [Bacillota bacterium]HPO97097.1 penicillin-binding protein 2 [Bacillota bacterium]
MVKDNVSKQLEPRFRVLAGVVLLIFLALVARLWMLQIVQGATSMLRSINNQTARIRIAAPRGLFYDRNNQILVDSRISHNVLIAPKNIQDREKTVSTLSRILKISEEEINTKIDQAQNPNDYIIIKKNIDLETVMKLREEQFDLPDVEVDTVHLRNYRYGELAGHLFGYIREIDQKELEQLKDEGYQMGDLIGKTGLERTYEKYLRGVEGRKVFEVDIQGQRKSKPTVIEPQNGDNLHLTIDLKIQAAAEKALVEQLEYLQKNTKYKNAKSGAVVVLDPRNGDILAMVSKPGYDPNIFVGPIPTETAKYLYDRTLIPMVNRAIQGEFAPGSTFKTVTTLAALMENKATDKEHFFCNGYDPVWKNKFKCWTVGSNAGGHGRLNVIGGLKNSCNIVMAELGRRIGPNTLAKYAKLLGFGKPTGLELLPKEKSGLIPDPDWKRKHTSDKEWYPLETLHFSIGQGYLTVTPLQLAVHYAALANGGKIYQPRVVTRITSATGELRKSFKPVLVNDLKIPRETLKVVQQGLEEVVASGTAASYYRGFPLDKYPIAGKTGTAQRPPYDNTAVFASYAPADKPEIVVVVLVEQGGSGSSGASPIARKVFEAYFGLDEKAKETSPKQTAERQLVKPQSTKVAPSAAETKTGSKQENNNEAVNGPSENASTNSFN